MDPETLETAGQISTHSGARPRNNGSVALLRNGDIQTEAVCCMIVHGLDGLMPQETRESNVRVLKDLLRPLKLHSLCPQKVMKCYGFLLEATPFLEKTLSFYVVDADQYRWALLPDLARSLTPGGKLDLLRKAAGAVAYLHSLTPPIVHNHVEPQQFLVSPNHEHVVLRNFGLKHRLHCLEIPQTGISISGLERNIGYTLGYASPAYMGAFVDDIWFDQTYEPSTADDVFTFAGTILKIMSDVGPYERRRGPSGIVSAVSGKPPSRAQHPNLPPDDPLWSLLLRMWDAQNPLARPSMDVVVRELGDECYRRGGPDPLPIPQLNIPGVITDTSMPTLSGATDGRILAEELPENRLFYPADSKQWSGPYSDVHKAWYTLPNQGVVPVAVKKLKAFNADSQVLQKQLLSRLAREATIWLSLNHEYILKLYGYQSSPEPVLVSPWSDTGNLRKFLSEGPPLLNLAPRLRLMLQVAIGINYLHQREPDAIIHGDIKPENIVLGPQGQALLCDFGLARIHNSATGHTEHVGPTGSGTQGYRAPEVIDPWTQDKPADIWALGSLFVTCLSLREPWYHVQPSRKWVEAVAGVYPSRDQHPGLPATNKLWDLIEWCWDPDPDRRPNSMEVVSTLVQASRSGLDSQNDGPETNLTHNVGSISLE